MRLKGSDFEVLKFPVEAIPASCYEGKRGEA
jgi:hypothetical protein